MRTMNGENGNASKRPKPTMVSKRSRTVIQAISIAAFMSLCPGIPTLAADGWQQNTNGQWVYIQNEKKAANQWVIWPDGTWRFVDSSGTVAMKRWINFENNRYYVKEDGSRYENSWFSIDSVPNNPLAKVSTAWYYAGADGAILRDGWYNIGGRNYYFYAGGNSPKKTFFNVGEERFYVGEDGAREENGWFAIQGVNAKGASYTNYYYADADGVILKNGWHELGGKYYYFDTGGNSPRKNWVNIEQSRYYVDEDGVRMQNSWFAIRGVNGNGQEYENWYYATPDGVILQNGWADLDGGRYYFDQNGSSYRKRWYVDGEKKRYYLDENGLLQRNGWFKISNTNANTGVVTDNWYYADENGAVTDGGYREIDGKTYYFDANGTMYKKRWLDAKTGIRQYFGADGALYQDTWFGIDGTRGDGTNYTNWYHANEKGAIQKNGWFTIDGKEYHFNSGGVMTTGWYDDKKYYLGVDGAKRHGWHWLEIEDDWIDDSDHVADHFGNYVKFEWFYFSKESGKKRYCTSGTYTEIKVDGVTYGFDNYGILQRGWVKVKGMSPALKGYRYYYPDDDGTDLKQGQLVAGRWLKVSLPDAVDGPDREEWHYFLPTGEPVCAPAGKYVIKEIAGKRYAFDTYGNARSGLLEIDGDIYYFAEQDGFAGVEGKCVIEEEGTGKRAEYRFNGVGKGITGLEDGYFYYKGKLQKAASQSKYEVFDVPGKGKRLISESGKVVKGKKVKDGDGSKWIINGSGNIMEYGSDYVAEIEEPETVEYDR